MLGDVLSGGLVNEIQWMAGSQRVGRGDAGGSSGLELMGGVSVGDVWYAAIAAPRRQPAERPLLAQTVGHDVLFSG